MAYNSLSEAERLEYGLNLVKKIDRLEDKDLRILICTATYFVLDGVTLTIRRLEAHLRSRGATVKILSTVPDNLDYEQTKDIIKVPGIKIPFNHVGDYSFGIGLDENTLREIEKYQPNCVHFTVPDFVGLDGIRWCQRNNVAYIGTWHSNYCDYLKYYFIEWVLGPGFHRYLKGFFEQIPTVYVPTPYMLKKMRDDWGYGSCTELKEWGRGVDMHLFSPERRSQAFRASKHINEDDVVVLWVSRLVPEKRPDIWLNVVKRLQDEGLPVKSLVVGTGTFEKYLSKLSHVSICGWLSGNALGEAYASSDILLFPSDVETFGNVTLEALSCGCPCIVEKKCGDHLVDHNINGITCPAGDFEAFYQATRKLVVDKQLRKQMSKAAREKAWKFERNIILQQMAENYKDAIEKHSDPSFLKRHMESAEGAGRNFLAVVCCNYYFIKMIAEPFLNTSRGVQDIVDNTSECIQVSRSRLSCSDFMSSNPNSTTALSLLSSKDEEEGLLNNKENKDTLMSRSDSHNGKYDKGKRYGIFTNLCSNNVQTIIARAVHYITLWMAIAIVLIFVYASFTVV